MRSRDVTTSRLFIGCHPIERLHSSLEVGDRNYKNGQFPPRGGHRQNGTCLIYIYSCGADTKSAGGVT